MNKKSYLRRVRLPRTPADWLEAVMNFIFFLCGMLAVCCVVLISVYMVVSGVPAIHKIGLFKFLFGTKWASTAAEEDFFTVKGALEALAAGFGLTFNYQRETAAWLHPGISAAVYCNGKRLGVFGKLANEINAELEIAKEQKDSQNIYLGELDYEALMSCVEGELRYKPLSPYAPEANTDMVLKLLYSSDAGM